MMVVTIYIKANDPTCEEAIASLNSLQDDHPHQLAIINIENEKLLRDSFEERVPVVHIGPYKLHSPFTQQDLVVALGAARDRSNHLERIGDKHHERRIKRGRKLNSADRMTYWISHHYMGLINVLLFMYVGLPFLAPVLARMGADFPSRVLYTIYRPLCHQLSFRSWFIFGEQAYYPRDLAGISGVASYEKFFGADSTFLDPARRFIGNEEIGYGLGRAGFKVALCQRDIAIYGAMLLFGLVFAITGKRIKTIPWYLWVAFGLVPIGLDGVSQLPSLLNFLPDWLFIRESTPLLRSVTGMLFGLTTAWYLFPMIAASMRDAQQLLAGKMAVVAQIEPQSNS
jgi:uncharacterized membrane protein